MPPAKKSPKKKAAAKKSATPRKNVTSYERAEILARHALTLPDWGLREMMARKAVETCPDSVTAWLVLASATEDLSKAQGFYEEAVEAGKRGFPEAYFEDEVGQFWLLPETRPYMDAVEMLATFHLEGRRDPQTAASYLRDLLRLNPEDNQGNRYKLFRCLFEAKEYAELEALLARYDENTAGTNYARWLWRFATKGPQAAGDDLQKAFAQNRYVILFLLGAISPPDGPEPFYESGSEEEAAHCLVNFIPAFEATDGAMEWMMTTVGSQLMELAQKTSEEIASDPNVPENIRTFRRAQMAFVTLTSRIMDTEANSPAFLEAAELMGCLDGNGSLTVNGDDIVSLYEFFLLEFERDGVTPMQKHLAANTFETESEKKLLNALINSTTSLFRVEGKNKRKGIIKLSDLLNPGPVIEVTAPGLAEDCQPRQGLFMRIVEFENIVMNTGLAFAFDSFGLKSIPGEISKVMDLIRRENPHLSESAVRFLAADEISFESDPWFP